MFPTYCGAMGFAGWLLMLLVWAALVAVVVWAITRLFPDRPSGTARGTTKGETAAPQAPVERPGRSAGVPR